MQMLNFQIPPFKSLAWAAIPNLGQNELIDDIATLFFIIKSLILIKMKANINRFSDQLHFTTITFYCTPLTNKGYRLPLMP